LATQQEICDVYRDVYGEYRDQDYIKKPSRLHTAAFVGRVVGVLDVL